MPMLYVVEGATCTCSSGTFPATLMSTSCAGPFFISGMRSLTIMDKLFVPSFGLCLANGGLPCVPVTPTPWAPMHAQATIAANGITPLLQSDVLPCVRGGTITVLSPGQASVDHPGPSYGPRQMVPRAQDPAMANRPQATAGPPRDAATDADVDAAVERASFWLGPHATEDDIVETAAKILHQAGKMAGKVEEQRGIARTVESAARIRDAMKRRPNNVARPPTRCWVAAAIYGPHAAETAFARAWVDEGWQGPAADAARAVYDVVGPRLAPHVERHPRLGRALRPLYDRAARRGVAYLASVIGA